KAQDQRGQDRQQQGDRQVGVVHAVAEPSLSFPRSRSSRSIRSSSRSMHAGSLSTRVISCIFSRPISGAKHGNRTYVACPARNASGRFSSRKKTAGVTNPRFTTASAIRSRSASSVAGGGSGVGTVSGERNGHLIMVDDVL